MTAMLCYYGWSCRRSAALALTALALVFMFVWFPAASRDSGSAANRVVTLQRAYTPAMFVDVLRRWSASRNDAVSIVKHENILRLDSIFPAVYGLALAFAYASLSGRSRPTTRDAVFFLVPIVAAMFDYLENTAELVLLRGIDTAADVEAAARAGAFPVPLVLFASACAHAKYGLLLVAFAGVTLVTIERLRTAAHSRAPMATKSRPVEPR
jgi:hypothetical protein